MKTTIYIDDRLLRDADKIARSMGLSRSRLFALAMADFLERQRGEQMFRQLNEVYGKGTERGERRLVKGIKAKVRPTAMERW